MPARLLRRFHFTAALALAVLTSCEPPKDPSSDEGALGSDGMVPMLRHLREIKPGNEVLLLLSQAEDPHQVSQANQLSDLVRQTEGLGLKIEDAKGSTDTQIAQIRAAQDRSPQVVIVVPVDAALITPVLQELHATRVPVIGLDSALGADAVDTLVVCDQEAIAQTAATFVIEALRRKAQDEGRSEVSGRVVQISAGESHPASRRRAAAFEKALQAEPGAVLVHDAPGEWTRENVLYRLREAFRLQKQFDVIYAHNDLIAKHAEEAAREASQRENILILGTDALAGTGGGLQMVRSGQIDASVHQPLLVDFAWRVFLKMRSDPSYRPKPRHDITPFVVTVGNIDEMIAKGPKFPEL
jgi:ABC-type sugar transport system substrate-binding protein